MKNSTFQNDTRRAAPRAGEDPRDEELGLAHRVLLHDTTKTHHCKDKNVDLIVLSGYMRFIGKVLLEAYPKAIINLHPAYLPEFPGAHSIQDAFEAGVSQTGVTVHYVDEGVDTGPIIRQKRVPIDPNWNLETLEEHVHAMEYDLFWQVIKSVAEEMEGKK